jgi:branched-chain amino acid aminotransferase
VREWVCQNGRLISAERATVSVFDAGFMQGIGLFTTMRAYNGVVFRLRQHIERLVASAQALGWTVLPEAEDLTLNVLRVVEAVGAQVVRARLTVTTGSLRAGTTAAPSLTVLANASPDEKYPAELYQRGVTLTLARALQVGDPTAGHKTTSYFARLATLREAHTAGAFEALWLTPDGDVAEGAISNVFIVKDDILITPPLDTPVLPGITRAAVIEAAVEADIPVQERLMTLSELRDADEVFLTNCLMEVLPVVRLDRSPIGLEKPGDNTRDIAEVYGRLVEKECGRG